MPEEHWITNRNFGLCRSFGHQWDIDTRHGLKVEKGGLVRVVLACRRCKSQRPDLLSLDGELEGRSYRHTKGYLFKLQKNQKQPSRIAIRGETLRLLFKSRLREIAAAAKKKD